MYIITYIITHKYIPKYGKTHVIIHMYLIMNTYPSNDYWSQSRGSSQSHLPPPESPDKNSQNFTRKFTVCGGYGQ